MRGKFENIDELPRRGRHQHIANAAMDDCPALDVQNLASNCVPTQGRAQLIIIIENVTQTCCPRHHAAACQLLPESWFTRKRFFQ
jgi:hypothetical protein